MNHKGVCVFVIVMIFLGACGSKIDTNMSETMADFKFTTQHNKTLGLEDLKGDWWIANFAYTHCRTICPRTTANMVDVQKRLNKNNLHPIIVSFSIDPSNDSPTILKAYAEEYGADQKTWRFLTGYDFETIQKISENTFKATLTEGAAGQRSHSYAFYLINPDGDIIKRYDGMSKNDLDILINDMQTVLK